MKALAQLRAMQALDAAGLPRPARLEPASSVTNEVWLAGDVVVRINRGADGRLRREAALAKYLPPDLGYPGVVAYGGRQGSDWLIVRRVPGTVLSRHWPSMPAADRRAAICQLARKLRALHATRTPRGLPPIDSPQLLEPGALAPAQPLFGALERATRVPNVDRSLVHALTGLVYEYAPALLPFSDSTLVHGDLTFENVLWDGRSITAVLDFEWSRGAPRDVDLDVFLRMCAFPFLHVAADYEHVTRPGDYVDVPRWLAEEYPDLFTAPRLFERLVVYSIAYDVRELLAHPPRDTARNLSPYHPLNRLLNAARGSSHLRWLEHARV
ncbi:MAG TPA: phosphotransferase [Acidimicrobiales bacterium]|jgi:aminoglycoside phosphotransferase (APT) family kinase protein|nr:phosphotransferase [Acidimicrobiales bacterium]